MKAFLLNFCKLENVKNVYTIKTKERLEIRDFKSFQKQAT